MKTANCWNGIFGLYKAALLVKHYGLVALDIIPEKIDLVDAKKPPIVNAEI